MQNLYLMSLTFVTSLSSSSGANANLDVNLLPRRVRGRIYFHYFMIIIIAGVSVSHERRDGGGDILIPVTPTSRFLLTPRQVSGWISTQGHSNIIIIVPMFLGCRTVKQHTDGAGCLKPSPPSSSTQCLSFAHQTFCSLNSISHLRFWWGELSM